MSALIAIDIGGTQLRAAAFLHNQTQPACVRKAPTLADRPGVYDRLEALVASVWPEDEKVQAIGVASPGPLNAHTGVILSTPNIPEWRNFPLAARLQERFGVPVLLDNDANLAALGEWRFGAGRGHAHVLYLTISTGIGGGVIIENRLLRGRDGMAAELGHLTVLPDGPLCGCGQRGHLEALASGPAIVRTALALAGSGTPSRLSSRADLTAREVAEAARAGDAAAQAAFEQAGYYLGLGVAGYLHMFNPSILIFGGGVSHSGDVLWKPFRASLQAHVMDPAYLNDLVITTAALGDDAGLLGALALAMSALESP